MTVVGNADIIVRAITDSVKSDIQKAFKDIRPMLKEEGQLAGKDYSMSFTDEVNQRLIPDLKAVMEEAAAEASKAAGTTIDEKLPGELKSSVRKVGKTIENELKGSGGRGGKGFLDGFLTSDWANEAVKASKAFTTAFALGNIGGTAISGLVSSLSAAVSGLFAMGSAASQAAGALAVLPGIYLTLGQAMGTVRLASLGMDKALTAGLKAAAATGKDAKEANKLFEEQLKQISPAAGQFVKYLISIKDEFTGLRDAAGAGLFPRLEEALKTIIGGGLLDVLQDRLKTTGTLIGEAAKGVANLFDADSKNRLGRLLEENNDTLRIFTERGENGGNTFSSLTRVILRLGVAIQPLVHRFADWINSLIDGARMATNTRAEMAKLTDFFNRAGDRAALLGDIAKNLWDSLVNLGSAADHTGVKLLHSFRNATAELVKFTDKLGEKKSTSRYFEQVGTNLTAIGKLINKVAKEFVKLGDNKGIAAFANGIRPAITSIGNIIDQMTAAGGPFAEFINNIAALLEAVADSQGLILFFDILNSVLGLLVDFAGTDVGGALILIVGGIAAVTRAFSLMYIAGNKALQIMTGGTINIVRTKFKQTSVAVQELRRDLQVLGREYSTVATKSERFAVVAKSFSGTVKTFAKEAGRVAGPIAAIGIAATGAADGVGLTNTASLTVAGTMAGPWGAAIGGAIGLWMDASSAADAAADSVQNFDKSLGTGNIDKLKASIKQFETQNKDFLQPSSGWWDSFTDSFKAGLIAIGGGGDEALHSIEQYKQAREELKDAQKAQRAAESGYAQEIRKTGFAAVAAEHGIKALDRAIDAHQKKIRGQLDAEVAWGQAIIDANHQIKEGTKGLDLQTEAGQANFNVLSNLAAAAKGSGLSYDETIKKIQDYGKALGVNEQDIQRVINATLSIPKKWETKYAFDLDMQPLERAKAAFGDLPKDLQTKIEATHIPQTEQAVDRLVEKYDLTEKERKALITLSNVSQHTSKWIDDMNRKLNDLEYRRDVNVFVNFFKGHQIPGNDMGIPDEIGPLYGQPSGGKGRQGRGNNNTNRQAAPQNDNTSNRTRTDNTQNNRSIVFNVDRVEAHDYNDFVTQMQRRSRAATLGGFG